MKHRLVIQRPFCTVLVLGLMACAGRADGLDLVRDGAAAATIVVPDSKPEIAMRAAGWLQDTIEQASGAALDVVAESEAPAGPLVSVGHTTLAEQAGVTANDLRWDGCRIVAEGRVLFLIGRDTLTTLERERWRDDEREAYNVQGGAQGTCQAVTTFLERFCGVRWFVPGPNGQVVPEFSDLTVPDETNILFQPAFAFLHGRYVYGSQLGPAAIANNNRTAIRLCTFGGHSWPSWMPPSVYYDDHPEYYALLNGERSSSAAGHLCTTNPEVAQILLKEIRARFDAGFDWVQLGQSDSFLRCQCESCEAQDSYRGRAGSLELTNDEWLYTYLKHQPCDRIHRLHKWIADQCMLSHPDKTVHLLLYSATTMPSKKFDSWPANTVGELCDIDPRVIVAWENKIRAKTTYMCWFLIGWRGVGYGVMVTPRQISERIRYLRDHDFIGIYLCGGGGNWGLQGPTYYTMGKMVGDPSLDYREVMAEYCRGMYGAAAETMLDFYTLLYTRESDTLMYNYFNRDQASPGDRLLAMYPPELLDELDSALQLAEAEADTERARKWVQFTRDHVDVISRCCDVMAAYRAYQVRPTADNLLDIEHHINAFEEVRQRIVSYDDEHISNWFPGYMKLYNFLTSDGDYSAARQRSERHSPERIAQGFAGTAVGYRNVTIREPFTWNCALVKQFPFLAAPSKPDGPDFRQDLQQLQNASTQMVSNPSFETPGADHMPRDWKSWVKHGVGSMGRVSGEGATGDACVAYRGMQRGGCHRNLVIQPGDYVVVALVRTPEPLNPRAKVTVRLSGRAADNTVLKNVSGTTSSLPHGRWTAITAYGTIPKRSQGKDLAKGMFIVSVDNLQADETLYVDDMMLFQLDPDAIRDTQP